MGESNSQSASRRLSRFERGGPAACPNLPSARGGSRTGISSMSRRRSALDLRGRRQAPRTRRARLRTPMPTGRCLLGPERMGAAGFEPARPEGRVVYSHLSSLSQTCSARPCSRWTHPDSNRDLRRARSADDRCPMGPHAASRNRTVPATSSAWSATVTLKPRDGSGGSRTLAPTFKASDPAVGPRSIAPGGLEPPFRRSERRVLPLDDGARSGAKGCRPPTSRSTGGRADLLHHGTGTDMDPGGYDPPSPACRAGALPIELGALAGGSRPPRCRPPPPGFGNPAGRWTAA